jgi:hypothetical protein
LFIVCLMTAATARAVAAQEPATAPQGDADASTPPPPLIPPPSTAEPSVIVLPSGKSLARTEFDAYSLKCVKGTAGSLLKAVVSNSRTTTCMNYQGQLVVYGCTQHKPRGYAVSFWPGRDPETCYRAQQQQLYERQQQLRMQQMEQQQLQQQPLPQANRNMGLQTQRQNATVPVSFWDDVAVQCCAYYDQKGDPSGLISWHEDGTREYFRDCPKPGLRCLFHDDQLRAVFEHENKDKKDEVRAVHLISAGRIKKTFDSVEQARGDSEAGSAVAEFETLEAAIKKSGKDFQKAHQIQFQKYVASWTHHQGQKIAANIRQHDREREQMGAELLSTIKNAPASRTTVWAPWNNYLPVNID